MNMDHQKIIEKWHSLLAQDNQWSGIETMLNTRSCQDALDLVFRDLLPILPSSDISLIREVTFPDLQQIWKCDYLVEAEDRLVEEIVRTNLERDMKFKGFGGFAVDVGTEDREGGAYWVFRVDGDIREKLRRTRFIQLNSSFGSSFKGYRIWRINDQQAKEVFGLAAPGGSILLD